MDFERVAHLPSLLKARNELDASIAAVIGRPMTHGHLGEWIASQIFEIDLESSANSRAVDGRFARGALTGSTVNVKWYLKREGILDMVESDALDYYLVFTGPTSRAASSRGSTRPWTINAVYLFDARRIASELIDQGRRIGTATSLRKQAWDDAEIFPKANAAVFPLDAEQIRALNLFALAH